MCAFAKILVNHKLHQMYRAAEFQHIANLNKLFMDIIWEYDQLLRDPDALRENTKLDCKPLMDWSTRHLGKSKRVSATLDAEIAMADPKVR